MPFYKYVCREGHGFVELRKMSEIDEQRDCPKCGSETERVLTKPAPAIVKGTDTPIKR